MDFSSAFKSKKARKGKKVKKIAAGENDEADLLDDVNRDLEDELFDESLCTEAIEIPRNLSITSE